MIKFFKSIGSKVIRALKRTRDWFFGAMLWVEKKLYNLMLGFQTGYYDESDGYLVLFLAPIYYFFYGMVWVGVKMGFRSGIRCEYCIGAV